MLFKRWDVYVDPDNGKVTRIYLVKRGAADRELQLTWQSGKWYKIVTLQNVSGKIIAEKERKNIPQLRLNDPQRIF